MDRPRLIFDSLPAFGSSDVATVAPIRDRRTMLDGNAREKYGVPATGSPLQCAVIGAENLDDSIAFYRDALGFDVVDRAVLQGTAFETHWQLSPGARAEMAVLADRGCEVGRLALVRFEATNRLRIRSVSGQRFFGLVNLNFYTDDVRLKTKHLEAAGCRAWSEPVVHDMGEEVGQPIEVMLDGPDGIIINMIELQGRSPAARILRTRGYIDDAGGFNRCGATPVATSQHCVRDYDRAMAFYRDVLGMTVRNDVILQGEAMERFMDYPRGARTRDTYLQGNHVLGKLAVNYPLNFGCEDLAARAVPPHVGYFAQTFVVPDLGDALSSALTTGAVEHSAPVELRMPGLGRSAVAVVRNPGSGALQQLAQLLD
jgi:catechol 2,3-dioxygenase-like lactoylglutathione lyase family enzyme